MRIFIWVLGFILVGVIASFAAWGVEYLTDSGLWMVITGLAIFIAGCSLLVMLFLRQDDLDY